jgi:hypothetical protein
VVTLKAWFSCLFSVLKMGGINIGSALQVGFILHLLLAKYQAVVQEFCLSRHALTDASLQMVVKQCNNYDKDPWKGPIGKDGKPAHTPSANAAGADPQNPYKALSGKSFNYQFGQWKKALKDQKGKCIVFFDTARNSDLKMWDCPILTNLGFKLEKRTTADNSPQDAASRVGSEATTPAQGTRTFHRHLLNQRIPSLVQHQFWRHSPR